METRFEWLLDLANGKDARTILYVRLAVGVVLSIPDYPYSHLSRKEVVGVPVYGLTESPWRHFHPCEMKLGENVPN
jgi:phosphoribosylamine--glycine ligase